MTPAAADRVRVRTTYPFGAADRRLLESVDPRLELLFEGEDEPEWFDALIDPDVQVILGSYAPSDPTRVPRLRWVASGGAGIESMIPADPWSKGITVVNASGVHAVAMAEYILGAVLFASERVEARLAHRKDVVWGDPRYELAGRRLRGRTAAIVGYGSIGRETARLLHGCGMRILAVKANPDLHVDAGWREPGTGDPDGVLPERWAGPDGLHEVLAEADFVALTAPGTLRTANLIDAAALAAMRADAWIVNVGRGSLIDEAALADALRERRIGGAVLDVTVEEPLAADHPLRDLPNCLVTPHVSGLGGQDAIWHNTALLLAENLRRDLAGEPLLNVTSKAAGY
jgi:D-3-phosphoglycerate dehydrogenase